MENLPVIQIGWWHSWSARQVYSLHQPKSLLRQIIYSWAPSLWGGHGKCRLTLVLANSLKHRFALRSGPWCPSEHISKSPIVDRNTEFSNPHIDFGAQSSTIITHPVCLGYLRPVKCFKHKRVLHKSFTQIFNCALIFLSILSRIIYMCAIFSLLLECSSGFSADTPLLTFSLVWGPLNLAPYTCLFWPLTTGMGLSLSAHKHVVPKSFFCMALTNIKVVHLRPSHI